MRTNLWPDIYALVYSLGYRSVNALEDALATRKVAEYEAERVALVREYLGQMGATS